MPSSTEGRQLDVHAFRARGARAIRRKRQGAKPQVAFRDVPLDESPNVPSAQAADDRSPLVRRDA